MSTPDEGEDDDVPPPRVPTESLDGWKRVETSVERLFGVEGVDVRGHTVVYEDRRRRRAVREATDGEVDRTWRFVFATRLQFRPPLTPGAASLILPTVRRQATRTFREDLRDRGVADVETGRLERLPTGDGEGHRVRQVTGSVTTSAGTVPIEGWVGVHAGEAVHVAGGAYPRTSLASALGIEVDTAPDREHLFEFVAAVG